MSDIFHDPDDAWAYAKVEDISFDRWPFCVPCPFVWNGAGWIRWYGGDFTDEQAASFASISSEFGVMV